MQENNITYIVKEVKQEATNVVTLKLIVDGFLPVYKAGQFVTIFFPETGHKEGKSYSISSAPSEKTLNLTVKGFGTFSNKLITKKVGDIIIASTPYGYFYSESETSPLVIVTGGIGVVPFRGVILDSLTRNRERKILLICSYKKQESIVFKKEFDELSEKSDGIFTVKYHLTQEDAITGIAQGRVLVSEVVEASKCLPEAEFFICGSIPFVRDFWKGLKNSGVSEDVIYTEAFF